ncbi:dTDP-4-dehydrorhamnose 3,5-epimerase [Ruminococcaceae bacterium OttesenSCG-928-D13]|nr:dTDP-4-dehydrorhamnose 3,5-epimerase [Ruminococcaceae bacterium OttesenSCG-928-D13]
MAKFAFIETGLPGVLVVEPTVFGDDRGFFMETWRDDAFTAAGIPGPFVQDNHSKSRKGVLRGLHFQRENTQGKLVRVISGRVFDVAVDCRPNSPAFGKWTGVELSAENKRQFWVPGGFAHGFLVLSDEAEFIYKCTDLYNPAAEGGIRWDDPDVGIRWPDAGSAPLLSEKDEALPGFMEQDFSFFERWYTP